MFTHEIAAVVPLYQHTRGSKRALGWHLPALMRALLILADGYRTANDFARLLHKSLDELIGPLNQLIDMGLVEWVIPAPLPNPLPIPAYLFPLPLSVRLFCGGVSYGRPRNPSDQRAASPGRNKRSIRGQAARTLFAA